MQSSSWRGVFKAQVLPIVTCVLSWWLSFFSLRVAQGGAAVVGATLLREAHLVSCCKTSVGPMGCSRVVWMNPFSNGVLQSEFWDTLTLQQSLKVSPNQCNRRESNASKVKYTETLHSLHEICQKSHQKMKWYFRSKQISLGLKCRKQQLLTHVQNIPEVEIRLTCQYHHERVLLLFCHIQYKKMNRDAPNALHPACNFLAFSKRTVSLHLWP